MTTTTRDWTADVKKYAANFDAAAVDGIVKHLGIAQKVRRTVELCAEPFVRIEDDRIRLIDPFPEMPELRANHRRPGPPG